MRANGWARIRRWVAAFGIAFLVDAGAASAEEAPDKPAAASTWTTARWFGANEQSNQGAPFRVTIDGGPGTSSESRLHVDGRTRIENVVRTEIQNKDPLRVSIENTDLKVKAELACEGGSAAASEPCASLRRIAQAAGRILPPGDGATMKAKLEVGDAHVPLSVPPQARVQLDTTGAQPLTLAGARIVLDPNAAEIRVKLDPLQIKADDLKVRLTGDEPRTVAPPRMLTAQQSVREAYAASTGLRVNVRYALVSVPDPRIPRHRRGFDLSIQAITRGFAKGEYSLDQFSLPWKADGKPDPGARNGAGTSAFTCDADKPCIGLMTFRSDRWRRDGESVDAGPAVDIWAIYLVGERQTSGIDQLAFVEALSRIRAQQLDADGAPFASTFESCPDSAPDRSEPPDPVPSQDVTGEVATPVFAPAFSGSMTSLYQALASTHRAAACWVPAISPARPAPLGAIHVQSYSATAKSNERMSQAFAALAPGIQLKPSLAVDDLTRMTRLVQELARLGIAGTSVALLTESSDYGYGVEESLRKAVAQDQKAPGGTLGAVVMFPPSISTLRLQFEASRASTMARAKGEAPRLPSDALELTIAEDDVGGDLPTEFTPQIMARAKDLQLSRELQSLARVRPRVVVISATEIRDRLFLARRVRDALPHAILVNLEADVLTAHPDYLAATRGMLVMSSTALAEEPQVRRDGSGAGTQRALFQSFATDDEALLFDAAYRLTGAEPSAQVAGTATYLYRVERTGLERHRTDPSGLGWFDRAIGWLYLAVTLSIVLVWTWSLPLSPLWRARVKRWTVRPALAAAKALRIDTGSAARVLDYLSAPCRAVAGLALRIWNASSYAHCVLGGAILALMCIYLRALQLQAVHIVFVFGAFAASLAVARVRNKRPDTSGAASALFRLDRQQARITVIECTILAVFSAFFLVALSNRVWLSSSFDLPWVGSLASIMVLACSIMAMVLLLEGARAYLHLRAALSECRIRIEAGQSSGSKAGPSTGSSRPLLGPWATLFIDSVGDVADVAFNFTPFAAQPRVDARFQNRLARDDDDENLSERWSARMKPGVAWPDDFALRIDLRIALGRQIEYLRESATGALMLAAFGIVAAYLYPIGALNVLLGANLLLMVTASASVVLLNLAFERDELLSVLFCGRDERIKWGPQFVFWLVFPVCATAATLALSLMPGVWQWKEAFIDPVIGWVAILKPN